ncbi:MAG: hypothetical protein UT05_C0014G0003 [Parcubacteria group bacterium GW2011_GWF2_38_76]|nr:MAG: hypothetical protein UT05_C0014G0003 [Parcubacteria group bacterium GW2011_GWF2_38_76]HBM46025.1 hypothetical protein [Patescibacteria group bacterium]
MDFIENVKSEIINPLIVFILAISVVYFLYGVFEFMYTGDAKKMEEGKKHILWGLIGLFIIVAVAGIMGFVGDTVNALKQ